jgi:Family of unknown function (DUF5995)
MDVRRALVGPPVGSIEELQARLAAIGAALPPNDGLACFNRMYRLVTELVRQRLGAQFFADPVWMDRLDVVFGNLYLAAVDASVERPDEVPPAWAALLERRSDARITPLQFALAGMNAHINRDLPLAVVNACADRVTTPDAGSHRADYEQINSVLEAVEQQIRESFEGGLAYVVPGLQDVVANWDIQKARETAWQNALILWSVRQTAPALEPQFLDSLDHLVGFAGRGLLTPLMP